jgi:hypothetical protein
MGFSPRTLVQRASAQVESLPAPVGGWNARDSLANMDAMDAVTMVNMFPTVSSAVLRGGYTEHATGLDGQVQSLMTYAAGPVTELFAVTDTGKLYDVTSSGPVGAPLVTGLSGGVWEHVNITTSAGSYLVAVNGANEPGLYDGTTWTSISTGSGGTQIFGVTTSDLINVVLFKNRLWFIEKNTLNAWYLPTDSIYGTAQKLEMTAIARHGGHLVDLDTWTIDAGYGVDDNLAFITSEGEVILWSGTDPSNANTFALIGVWKLGSPIGQRCMLKWGGDLLVLTYDGLVPMASSLQSSRLDPRVALSDKIQGAITAATTAYGGDHTSIGWQITYTAKHNAVWINVPVSLGSQEQYVMNTITKSWCQFQGWAANCWEIYEDDAYFGGNGIVGLAWDETYADNGADIETSVIQAFNYFGSRGVKKYFTRARYSLFTNGSPSIFVGMNTDFDVTANPAPLSFSVANAATWDVSLWDVGYWGAGLVMTNQWQGVTGIGYCGGLQFKSSSQGVQIEWASTDVVYQTGWAGI